MVIIVFEVYKKVYVQYSAIFKFIKQKNNFHLNCDTNCDNIEVKYIKVCLWE